MKTIEKKDTISVALTEVLKWKEKAAKEIKGKTILEHCIDRIKRSIYIDLLIVATTTDDKDDIIVNLCQKLNVEVFRGSEQDCLDRYYNCALKYNADIIIRLTSDCPLIDPSIIDNVIYYFQNNTCKYLKNTWYPEPLYGYPSGFDVEVFAFNSLKEHIGGKSIILEELLVTES